MIKKFIGRKDELKVLRASYQSKASSFIVIYGRRRVGKSELILQFLSGKTGIYYLGKQARSDIQISEFLKEASNVLKQPLLAKFSASDWGEAYFKSPDLLNVLVTTLCVVTSSLTLCVTVERLEGVSLLHKKM